MIKRGREIRSGNYMLLIALLSEDIKMIEILTSSSNGIDGPPFIFLGFSRGSSASMKAFPPLLHMQQFFQY